MLFLCSSGTVGRLIFPRKYEAWVEQYAAENGLPEEVVYSIVYCESGFDPNATSNVGAIGLTQVTEITFDWLKSKIRPENECVFEDLYDADTSIRFGAYYLSRCLPTMWIQPWQHITADGERLTVCWKNTKLKF